MKNLKISIFVLTAIFIAGVTACGTSKLGFKVSNLYRVWNVKELVTKDKTVSGTMMGNPTYEFTKEGKRIKRLPPAPEESVGFVLKKGIIEYPGSKYPTVTIEKLTEDSLILKNENTRWVMYK